MRQLTQKDIFEKNFNTKMRGFDPKEVDEFLDIIMQDYNSYDEEIEELKQENAQLTKRVEELAQKGSASGEQDRTTPRSTTSNAAAATNFDILKRISNLERAVFGSKLEDKASK